MRYKKFNVKKLLFIALASVFCQLQAQQTFKTTTTSVIGYLEYLPQDYNLNSNKYPIVIFLHGIGERGPNTTDLTTLQSYIGNVAKHGPPKHVKNGTQFPFILISPQLKNNYGNWPTSYVMEVINYVKTYLRVDERRIYITGMSLGGGGTWTMAQTFPKLFAAVAPVCGGYNAPSKACNIAAENVPVWAFHGDADTVVPYYKSVNMVNAINNCSPVPNPKAKIDIYNGVKHNAWDKAYTPDHTIHNPNVYDWMMSYTNSINNGNKIPLANAGTDIVTASSTISITGSATDIDGTIAAYQWSVISGPSAILTNATSKSLTVSNLVEGTYVFKLSVTDNGGESDSDYVKVTVQTQAIQNAAPVANAGANITIQLPTNAVTIIGTATDSDGSIVSYNWSKVSGGTATLSGATTSKLTVSNLLEGTYVFRLTVKDDDGATKSDDINVYVIAGNVAPIAKAGPNLTITLPTNSLTIVGAASDSDGSITSYTWTKVRGGIATLSGANTLTLKASELVEGTYTFKFTVTDNSGASKSDYIDLTVLPATVNVLPTVSAGPNITLTLPVNSVTVNGVASDSDGTIVSYAWTNVRGGVVTMTGTSTPKLTVTGMLEGFYVFRLTVKDNSGAVKYDDMGVTVKAPTTVSSSSIDMQQVVEPNEEPLTSEKTGLEIKDSNYWKNKSVIVYNSAGARIYAGSWSPESYNQVFLQEGLYVYNVVLSGQRVDAGKIYITR